MDQESIITPGKPQPGKVQAIAIMMLVNGILNILASLGVTFSVIVGTLGVGLLCVPVTILPTILGIFEIMLASNMLSQNFEKVKFNNIQVIAILEICCIIVGNLISLVIGIINLVFLGDPEVKDYLGV